jgi:DNA-binding transcriptional ArsR family regulator
VLAVAPESLIGLLAEPRRLRVFSAVVLGARTPAEVVDRTDLTLREVAEALRRLSDGGLVSPAPPFTAQLDVLKESARSAAGSRAVAEALDPDRARASVLRNFIVDGRLASIPATQSKRRIILEHIVAAFEPGVRYPEREVDAILRAWHPDHAALRRYLVDEQLLARNAGIYWRIGGPVF